MKILERVRNVGCQVPWHELRPKGALVEPPLPAANVPGSLARISAEGRRFALAGAWLRSGQPKKDGGRGFLGVVRTCRKSPTKSRLEVYIIRFYQTQKGQKGNIGKRLSSLQPGLKQVYGSYEVFALFIKDIRIPYVR